jgi:hypothetical protein
MGFNANKSENRSKTGKNNILMEVDIDDQSLF